MKLRNEFEEIIGKNREVTITNLLLAVEKRDDMILGMLNKAIISSSGGGNWRRIFLLLQDELRKRLLETR